MFLYVLILKFLERRSKATRIWTEC